MAGTTDGREFGLTSVENSSHREALNKHDMGVKKYRSKIDKGAREYSGPYSFSRPARHSARVVSCLCTECGEYTKVSKNTVMVICVSCNSLYSVSEANSSR